MNIYEIKIIGRIHATSHKLSEASYKRLSDPIVIDHTEFHSDLVGINVTSSQIGLMPNLADGTISWKATLKANTQLSLGQLERLKQYYESKHVFKGEGQDFVKQLFTDDEGKKTRLSFYGANTTTIKQVLLDPNGEVDYDRKVIKAMWKSVKRGYDYNFTTSHIYNYGLSHSIVELERVAPHNGEEGYHELRYYEYREEDDEEYLTRVVRELENAKNAREKAITETNIPVTQVS